MYELRQAKCNEAQEMMRVLAGIIVGSLIYLYVAYYIKKCCAIIKIESQPRADAVIV